VAALLVVADEAAQAQSTVPSHEAAAPPPSRASDQTATVPTADGTSQKPNRAAEPADPKPPNWMTTLIIIFAAQAAGHGPGAAFPK
jgi:hypothetical protein